MMPGLDSNKIEYALIKNVIECTMFGMTFLKGSENMNCLLFVHQA